MVRVALNAPFVILKPDQMRAYGFTLLLIQAVGWSASSTFALPPMEAPPDFSRQAWTTREGLPDNRIQDMAQTRDGYLWLATRRGLARFDGSKFTAFNRANSPAFVDGTCWLLAEDNQGKLWIATPRGALCYAQGHFLRYTTKDGLSNDVVESLCPAHAGGIWAGSFRGLNRFDGNQWRSYHISNTDRDNGRVTALDRVTALHEDRHGNLWVGTGGGLRRFDPATQEFSSDFPAHEHSNASIRAIYLDSADSLWVACWHHGSANGFLSELKDGKWIEHPEGVAVADGKTVLASFDQASGFWLSSSHLGIERFMNPVSKRLLLPLAGGVDEIDSLLEDREGNLWIGTHDNGLQCWRPVAAAIRTLNNGITDPNCWAVCEDRQSRLWVGTDYGIARFAGNELTLLTDEDGLSHRRVRSLAVDNQGRVLIGTMAGLDVFENSALRHLSSPGGQAEHRIRAILCPDDGSLWLGTDGGALRLQGSQWTSFTTNSGLVDNRAGSLFGARDASIWIGTPGGLSCFRDGQIITYRLGENHSNSFARVLFEEQENRLWIGTDAGLDLYEHGRFLPITKRQGLIDEAVKSLLDDGRGYFWIASEHGVYRVEADQLHAVAESRATQLRCVSFGEADGILSSELNREASRPSCKTRDGRLWFATCAGVVVVDPARLGSVELAPQVVIERVRSNEQTLLSNVPTASEQKGPGSLRSSAGLFGGLGQSLEQCKIEIPPGGGRLLVFEFTANTFIAPERVRFKCRLAGHDQDWIDLGAERIASYANLRPGSYRFQVIACNAHGVWNEPGATLAFYIGPFFYESAWFRAVCALALAGIIGGAAFWLLRTVQRLRSERHATLIAERARLAKDLHDGLGANLTQLTMLIDRAPRDPHQRNDDYLQVLSNSTREALQTLKEIIWASHPGDETLDGLTARICQTAQDFLSASGIRCRLDIPDELPPVPLSSQERWNLLLVAKEALTNVAKHAAAS